MSYSVYLYHTNDAKNVLTYPNSHFGSQGTIYLNTSNFPGPKVSHEVKTFIQDTADNTIYNSETITADPALNGNIALHTAAYYTTDAVGTLTVQGTLDAQIGAGTNWADISTTNLTSGDTLQYVNFNGVYQHLRFRHQITAGTIDKILVRN